MNKRAAILMLAALAATVLADNPEADSAYFHPGASLYIQGSITAASNLVARGLAEFPDDGKLKRLMELIEQQQQNEQNQQQNDQQDEQQDQQQDDQQQDDQQQDDQQQDDQQDQQEQNQQPPEPQRAEQMSRDEAEQLLDAMKQEEKNKRLELHPVMGRPVKVEKDW